MARNSMVLYGRNSVVERLRANPKSIRKVFLQDNVDGQDLEKLIKSGNVPFERVSSKALSRLKPVKDNQGIVATVDGFEYATVYDLLNQKLTPIFLDRIYDPQNLGSIIRTAACFGGFAVVIPRFKACGVTEAVLHVASGGENYVPVSMVSNLSNAIIAVKKAGYWIMGAEVSQEAEDLNQVSMPFPLGLVLGSEGEGIRYGVNKHLDLRVRIPMQGAKLSFNVAMACTIFCHEISKQRAAVL